MRDPVADATREAPSTVVAVWHWEPKTGRIVWAGDGLLSVLGLSDAGALNHDSANAMLRAASAQTVATGRNSISLHRTSRLFQGPAIARPLILGDGSRGWRLDWTVALPRTPDIDPLLAATAFDILPWPAALCGEDGRPVAMNRALADLTGDSALPLERDYWAARGWAMKRTPAGGGLNLATLTKTAPPDDPSLEAGTLRELGAAMRSPLTAILGFLEFLSQTADDLPPARRQAYLADLAQEVRRLERAVDALDGGAPHRSGTAGD